MELFLEFVTMKWKAAKLMNTDSVFDWWNKSDPYLKFLKVRQDGSLVLASQTEVGTLLKYKQLGYLLLKSKSLSK
jgi:hypothetical protein